MLKIGLALLALFIFLAKKFIGSVKKDLQTNHVKKAKVHLDYYKEIKEINNKVKKINNREEKIEEEIEIYINEKMDELISITKTFKKNYRKRSFLYREELENEIKETNKVLDDFENGLLIIPKEIEAELEVEQQKNEE